MSVFPTLSIYPILLPTQDFRDRFGNYNSYVEMNPSIHIEENTMTIVVRTVNYSKYKNNNFTVLENQSNSIYYILKGTLNNGKLHLGTASKVEIKYNIPIYSSYWKGLEDIRFISATDVLATIPEGNPEGNPCIFRGKLLGTTITNFTKCEPSTLEKNWMPYLTDKVIYSLYPFVVKSIEVNDLQTLPINDERLNGFHGSSNGIEFGKNTVLFLIHKNIERVYHCWLVFNYKENTIKLSEMFVFFNSSYIEFTCSLAKYANSIFVSLGVNDNKAFIIEVDSIIINEKLPSYYST